MRPVNRTAFKGDLKVLVQILVQIRYRSRPQRPCGSRFIAQTTVQQEKGTSSELISVRGRPSNGITRYFVTPSCASSGPTLELNDNSYKHSMLLRCHEKLILGDQWDRLLWACLCLQRVRTRESRPKKVGGV